MPLFRRKDDDSQHWLTISDLMSGLMILFIFIAIAFMRNAFLERERANKETEKFKQMEEKYIEYFSKNQNLEELIKQISEIKDENKQLLTERNEFKRKLLELEETKGDYIQIINEKERIDQELKQIKGIAETYQNNQIAIYQALLKAFPEELLAENRLNAEIDEKTLTFIFKSSNSLFDNASANLKAEYKNVLAEFFPRYIQAILPYKESISEIRIEGHTSSEWFGSKYLVPKALKDRGIEVQNLYSYFENMKLSQERTNSVLNYVLMDLKDIIPEENRKWLRDHTAAVGLSSSKLIFDENGNEDQNKSRRVTFRIITNADNKIRQILQQE